MPNLHCKEEENPSGESSPGWDGGTQGRTGTWRDWGGGSEDILERARASSLCIISGPVEVLDFALREMIDYLGVLHIELHDDFCFYNLHDYLKKRQRKKGWGPCSSSWGRGNWFDFRFDNEIHRSRSLQDSASKKSREQRKSRAQRN